MEKEPQNSQLVVSQRLEKALLAISQVNSGAPIDVPDLVLAMMLQDGIGKRSLEVVSKSNFSTSDLISSLRQSPKSNEIAYNIVVSGKEIPITSGVTSVLEEAQIQAKGYSCVDTGHIIQAELSRIDSVLVNSFDSISSKKLGLGLVLSNFIKIARDKREYLSEEKSVNKIDI